MSEDLEPIEKVEPPCQIYYLQSSSGKVYRCYRTSEVDKVIADKDKDIQRLEKLCESYRIDCDNLAISDEQAKRAARTLLKKMNHQKYKRCLAMAAVCFEKSYSTTLVKYDKESGYRLNFYDWWGNCWLALAEEPTWAKFLQLIRKEAK